MFHERKRLLIESGKYILNLLGIHAKIVLDTDIALRIDSAHAYLMAILCEVWFPIPQHLGFAMFNALPGKLFSNQLRKRLFWMVLISSTSDFILITPCSYKNQDKRGTWHYWDQSYGDSKETEVNVMTQSLSRKRVWKAVNVMKNGGYYFLNTYYIASIAQCKYIVSFG